MARINIDIGALGNPATGDTLRTAFTKINNNFSEVYSLVQDGSSGLIATDVTNGDLKLQANGTGSIEIDNLSITGDSITTIATNGSVDLTGNGTGGVNIEALHFNGTSINSADSSRINLNESVTVDGDLNVTGTITGTFSATAIGDITAVGSTLFAPSNADFDITPSGTGNVNLNGDTVRVGDNNTDATITTQGTGDLTLSTNGGTNSGTIKIADGANGDITLDTNGTGDVLLKGDKVGIGSVNQPDTTLHIKDTNAVITLQRTADANTPGLSFQNSNGNVRGVIKLDGTSGTSNEIFMQTYDGSSQAERFRVTHTGAKVSGTLNVDDGVSITDNTITSSASNADLEINASGTGTVVLENLKVGTGATVTTILDEDNMASNSATALSTQQSIKAYVDTQVATVPTGDITSVVAGTGLTGGGTTGDVTLNVIGGTGIDANANDIAIDATVATLAGTQTLTNKTLTSPTIDGFTFSGNTISTSSNADVELSPGGTGAVVLGDAIRIRDNHIEGTRSNEDVIIDPTGTGNVKIPTDKITLGNSAAAGTEGVAIGKGTAGVGDYAQAIGNNAGNSGQGTAAVALGSEAGETNQGQKSVAIGQYAGTSAQGSNSVAVGLNAGHTSQGQHGTAVGEQAGETSQGVYAVAIGMQAGHSGQGATGVAIGYQAGGTNQGTDAVAIGQNAGLTGQGNYGIGIGEFAGSSNQGINAIAIGEAAGKTNQAANSIVINASGSELNNTTASSLVVKPIRNASGTHGLEYNPTTGEVTYDTLGGGGSTGDLTITGSTISAPSNADLTLNAGGTGSVDIEGIQIKGTEISSTDSTQVTIKENLNVTGTITGNGSGITNVETIAVNDESSDTTCFPLFSTGATSLSSGLPVKTDQSAYKYNASTGSLQANSFVTSGIEVAGNKVTTNASNADLELDASGTGTVSFNGIKFPTSDGSNGQVLQTNGSGQLSFTNATSSTLNTAGNTGTGSVTLASQSLQVLGTTNEINVDAAAFALSLSLADNISGIVSVTASGFLANDAIKIIDNKITGTRSNENVELEANGTGGVIAQSPFTFNAGYIEKINTLTSASTITVNCALASIHKVTLATSTEFNISNLPTGGTVTLIITQDGSGSRTATFGTDGSTAVKFPGGAPTLSTGAGDIDIVTIVNDGTNFLGNCAKDYS